MRIITEAELREQYKQSAFTTYELPAGTRLTPAAAQFLSERRITVREESLAGFPKGDGQYQGNERAGTGPSRKQHQAGQGQGAYVILATGETVAEKPEFMTHLQGKNLVPKNHPRISFRGKLDSLEAWLILVAEEAEVYGYRDLAQDLRFLLEYARQMMRAEVTDQPLEALTYRGLSHEEIRARSHHPHKFYGVGHLFPQPGQGKLMAQLNLLRTQCRELEVAAVEAFRENQEERLDLLRGVNRLSSLVYLLMLQLSSGYYKIGSSGRNE